MHLLAHFGARIFSDDHTKTAIRQFPRSLGDTDGCGEPADHERINTQIVQDLVEFHGIERTTRGFVQHHLVGKWRNAVIYLPTRIIDHRTRTISDKILREMIELSHPFREIIPIGKVTTHSEEDHRTIHRAKTILKALDIRQHRRGDAFEVRVRSLCARDQDASEQHERNNARV